MRRYRRRVLGVLAWLGCAVAAVHAADDTLRPSETTQENAGAETRLPEVLVEAPPAFTAASSDELRARDFETRPHETLQEILNNVPGLIVRQHQGGGKATQFLVRGFNADHGTDFAVTVDGLPVNLVTHAHGQGYADLNFVIPETIERLQLWKGPYFAHLGDLATAGGLNLVTKEKFDENFVLAEGGSFEDRSITARGYLVMDVLAKYRWRNVEASLGLLNLGDFDWQEAVFADTSLTRCELTGRCPRRDRPDIHFTPGDPFGVRAGLKVFF